jgi:predicted permease
MGTHSNTFSIDGRAPIDQTDQSIAVQDRVVSPDYFRVMGIPLITGRLFLPEDASAPPVALVNQNFAHRFFPNENPIGQRLRFGSSNSAITIVGTVADVRGFGLDKQPRSEIYLSYQQKSLPYHPLSHLHLVVRTASDAGAIAKPLMALVRELDKDLPLPQARTMETVVAASVAARRFNMLLLAAFGAVALLLTGVGIYGVISYSVAQRVPEIGIRIALGAQPRNVIALVVRNGVKLALIGIAIGLTGAFTLTRWMASLLFEIGTRDGATFVGAALLLGSIALLASWVPARRAARVDPLIALRYE